MAVILEMRRYEHYGVDMELNDDGDWVRYGDHAAVIERLTKERDAAFAGGEELSAALRMANAEVARLRDGIAFIIQIIGHLCWCQTCAEDGSGECFNYGTLVADLIANHPEIAREMG